MMRGIPLYTEINDLHKLTGSALRTKNPLIHCFDMSKANDLEISSTEPHRVSFYTLALNFGTENLTYQLNDQAFMYRNFVLCVAPGQVATWEKKGQWAGYCLFFKSELLNFDKQVNFLQLFPFFNIRETNLIPLKEEDFKSLGVVFNELIKEQDIGDAYHVELIRAHLQAILWTVRRIYERARARKASHRAGDVITSQFQYMVNEYFLDSISVEDYAGMLNITPNHLSQTVRLVTGKRAKDIISERRLNEAKYLLSYTENPVSEVAYHLKFSEPTHFVKFFKKETGMTPLIYRSQ